MKMQMGKVNKQSIIARLVRDGMDRSLAETMADAAAKLIPPAAVIDGSAEPMAIFLYGVAAGFAQSAATFADTSGKFDDGSECAETKAATMRNAGLLFNVAAMIAAALAESVTDTDEHGQEVPQA